MSSPRTMWSIFADRRRRSSGEGQGLRSFLTFCLRGPDTAPTAYPAAKKPVPSLLGCCTAACYFRAFDQTQDWVRFANQLAVWVWAMAARGLLLCLPQDGAVPGKTMRTWTLAAVLFLGVLVSIDLEATWMAAPQSATTLASASCLVVSDVRNMINMHEQHSLRVKKVQFLFVTFPGTTR